MSSVVKDIREGIEAVALSNLDSTYQVLKHKFDVTKNNKAANVRAYGVEALSAARISGTTNALTLEQFFRITMINSFKNTGHGDTAIQTTIDGLNDKIIEISRELHLSKAGVPGSVLLTDLDTIEEPEILDDNEHIVIMRFNVLVQYRQLVK